MLTCDDAIDPIRIDKNGARKLVAESLSSFPLREPTIDPYHSTPVRHLSLSPPLSIPFSHLQIPPARKLTRHHNRTTGKTLPHLYIEVATLECGKSLIRTRDGEHLGGRRVRVKWARKGELCRDVRSSFLSRWLRNRWDWEGCSWIVETAIPPIRFAPQLRPSSSLILTRNIDPIPPSSARPSRSSCARWTREKLCSS